MWGTTSSVVDGIIFHKCRFFSVNTFIEAILLTSLKDQISIGVVYMKIGHYWGYPGGSDGRESACNAGNPGSILGSSTPVFLPGKFHGQRSLEIHSPWAAERSD